MVFLGTGAALPAKYRNVTGIYVNLFARGGLMLDCGASFLLTEWACHVLYTPDTRPLHAPACFQDTSHHRHLRSTRIRLAPRRKRQ